MQLLDLPPEIFQHVVRALVKKQGLKEAWKIRGTSKAFQSYITYEALAAPSLYAYNKTRGCREILKHNLADFLYIRSSRLNGFIRIHVPNFIRDVMLKMIPWVAGDEARSTLRKVLCELFVRNHADALKCVLTDTNKLNQSTKDSISVSNTATLVAAAAVTGNLRAIRHFANDDRQSLWVESPSFGFPLVTAVYARQLGVVRAIARQAITNQAEDVPDIPHAEHLAFRKAIATGIKLRHDDIVTYLLEKYVKAFGPATEECMASWLKTTVTQSNSHILARLLETPTHASTSTFYGAFDLACHRSKPGLFHLFFHSHQSSCLSINSIYAGTYPLLTAIGWRSVSAVKELLRLGADPNGPKYLASLARPLRAATQFGRDVGCLELLKAGANPHLVARKRWLKTQVKVFGRKTVKGRALGAAIALCKTPGAGDSGEFLAAEETDEEDE